MPVKQAFYRLLKHSLFFLLVMHAIACNNLKRKYILPEDKFVDVLVDIHLADAIALENEPSYSGFRLDSAGLYGSVFAKHAVTRAQFDSSVNYYSARPEEFQVIYNKVTGKLNLMLDNQLNAPIRPVEETHVEELIWEETGIYALPEMGSSNRVEINVPVKSVGQYTLSATVKLYADDESENPRISVGYWYDNGTSSGFRDNFEEIMLQKDGNQHFYIATKILSSPLITHIKGYILNHSNQDTLFQKHALVSEIKVTYLP